MAYDTHAAAHGALRRLGRRLDAARTATPGSGTARSWSAGESDRRPRRRIAARRWPTTARASRTVLFGGTRTAAAAPARRHLGVGRVELDPGGLHRPVGAVRSRVAYDSARQRTVALRRLLAASWLTGADTWEWDGSPGSRRDGRAAERHRVNATSPTTAPRQRSVLFGGRTDSWRHVGVGRDRLGTDGHRRTVAARSHGAWPTTARGNARCCSAAPPGLRRYLGVPSARRAVHQRAPTASPASTASMGCAATSRAAGCVRRATCRRRSGRAARWSTPTTWTAAAPASDLRAGRRLPAS